MYLKLFWSAFFPHFPTFGLNTGKCGKNEDQNNFKYGHFLRSGNYVNENLCAIQVLQKGI